MSIESNSQPQPSPEAHPFLVTPKERATREALFAPDEVDYSALSAGIEAHPEDTAQPVIEIPELEEAGINDPAPLPKRFPNGLLPEGQIPQLVDEETPSNPVPAPEEPRYNLLPADQIPQLAPDGPRHRL